MANEDQSITAEQALEQITRDPDLGRGDAVQAPAAPAQPPGTPPAAPAAQPASPQPQTSGRRYVPAAALEGERSQRKAAEEQRDRLRTAAQLYGFQVGDDGTITPPAQPQPVYQPPPQPPAAQPPQQQPAPGPDLTPFRELAARLGTTPEELAMGLAPAIGTVAAQMVAPLYQERQANAERFLGQRLQAQQYSDPQYPIYGSSLHDLLQRMDPAVRAQVSTDDALWAWTVDAARARHLPQLMGQYREQAGTPGVVVGRFVERASPGAAVLGNANAAQLPPTVDDFATKWGATPEQKARIAERIARRKE